MSASHRSLFTFGKAEKLQHNSNAGQAVRIFHSFLPNTPTSEKREEQRQNIHKIFERDDVADKAVAIISISGAFRQGKSFLSNLLLRHLQSWISSKNTSGQMNENEEIGNSFQWKPGVTGCTQGVWIWSEPFFVTTPRHGEVAVFLMDTQGIFQHDGKLDEFSQIFALSTLISSTQIYNVLHQIQEDNLQFLEVLNMELLDTVVKSHTKRLFTKMRNVLELFAEYGKMALTDPSTASLIVERKAFQKLLFLVRDWPHKNDYQFGVEGGKSYLETILHAQHPDDNRNIYSVRKRIRDTFESTDCFLMPSPSETVREGEARKLKDVGKRFLDFIDQLASHLFDPQKLTPKIIFGQTVKGKDFSNYFFSYIDAMKDRTTPQVESLLQATANGLLLTIAEDSKNIYVTGISQITQDGYTDEDVLGEAHQKFLEDAMKWYDGQRKLGSKRFIEKNRATLVDFIKKEYNKRCRSNAYEKGKLQFFGQEKLEEVLRQVKQRLDIEYYQAPVCTENVETFFQQCQQRASRDFSEILQSLPESLKRQFHVKLTTEIRKLLDTFEDVNNRKLNFRKHKDLLFSEYTSKMKTEEESVANVNDLDERHKRLAQFATSRYKDIRDEPLRDFEKVLGELKENISSKYKQIIRPMYVETHQKKTEMLQIAKETYDIRMKEVTKGGYVKKRSLKRKHDEVMDGIVKKVKDESNVSTNAKQLFLNNVRPQLEKCFTAFEQTNQAKRFEFAWKRSAAGCVAGCTVGTISGSSPVTLAAAAVGSAIGFLSTKEF